MRQPAAALVTPMVLVDPTDRLLFYNVAAERLLGLRFDETGEMATDAWSSRCMAYLSDHEPALGHPVFPSAAEWTSGHALAGGADSLAQDGQYSRAEYPAHVGWGHSSIDQAIAFAQLAAVGRLVTFHRDPAHDDDLERMIAAAIGRLEPTSSVAPAFEGQTVDLA